MGAKIGHLGLSLVLALAPLNGWSDEDVELDPHSQSSRLKEYPWQANVFVGSALLAAVAGVVVICLNGGTSKQATSTLQTTCPTVCPCPADCRPKRCT